MTTDAMSAEEAQRLLDGATPGGWKAYEPSEYPNDFRIASQQCPPVRYVGRLTRSHPNEPHPTKSDAALCAAAPRLAASVVALHAQLAQVTAERDALRAIVEGRTTPPSDEEARAHIDAGGVFRMVCGTRVFTAESMIAVDIAIEDFPGGRWWALDAQKRPCAWPVVDR